MIVGAARDRGSLIIVIAETKKIRTKKKKESKTRKKIYFVNKNIKIELGSFLTEEEKDKLIDFIERKVQQFNYS